MTDSLPPKHEVWETLSYKDIPPELTKTLDKMVFELDLLSKTVLALEQRLSHSENKMNEVIDYLSAVDTQGKERLVSTSAVIHTSTLLKDMPA